MKHIYISYKFRAPGEEPFKVFNGAYTADRQMQLKCLACLFARKRIIFGAGATFFVELVLGIAFGGGF